MNIIESFDGSDEINMKLLPIFPKFAALVGQTPQLLFGFADKDRLKVSLICFFCPRIVKSPGAKRQVAV